jgi:FkbM family methyltransferase
MALSEGVFFALSTMVRNLPTFRGKERVGRLISRHLFSPQQFLKPIRTVKMKEGHFAVLDARSRTELGAFWSGLYEPHLVHKLVGFVQSGDQVLDIGANVGLITIALAKRLKALGPEGHVFAFEPVPGNFERLSQACTVNQLDSQVTLNRMALGAEEGELEMAMEHGGGSGNAVQKVAVDALSGDWDISRAPLKRLDEVWNAIGRPQIRLIKIDVEGAELFVFQGGMECLTTCRPVIVAEFNGYWMRQFGYTKEEVLALDCFAGYEYYGLRDDATLVLQEGQWGDMGDIVMVPEELEASRRASLLGMKEAKGTA